MLWVDTFSRHFEPDIADAALSVLQAAGYYVIIAEPKHGHCHQKAVGAMKSMRKVLKLIPGLDFELIEASCCGMAGSFGLEAEHAAISWEMARQSLLPKLNQSPDSLVLSNGFSCRQQIVEGDGRRSLRLAHLFRDALDLNSIANFGDDNEH